jgi:Na+/melibiose symporter-like transporter
LKRLNPSLKLAYACGTITFTAQDIAFNSLILFYYRQVHGLSGSLAGLALLIALVCDALSDPFMGSFSDRFRSRWGRRHPFMVIGAILLAISFFFLFNPPAGVGELPLFLWLTVVAVAVRTFVTIFFVPYLALGAELSDDYHERSSVGTYRTTFGFFLGGFLYWAIMTFIFGPGTEVNGEIVDSRFQAHNYWEVALLFFVVVIFFSAISVFFTRKSIPHLPQQSEEIGGFSPLSVVSDLLSALRCRNFRVMGIVMMTTFAIFGVFPAVTMYVGTFFWELTPGQMGYGGLIGLAAAPFMFAILGPLGKRFDKQHILQFGLVGAAFNAFWFIGLRLLGILPENGHWLIFAFYLVSAFISQCCIMILHIIATSILAVIVDEQEYDTGQRQEGVLFAGFMFSAKSFSGLGTLMGGWILDFVQLDVKATPGEVPWEVLFKFGLAVGPLVGCLLVIPFMAARFFTLSRETHAEIKKALLKREQEAKASVSEEA